MKDEHMSLNSTGLLDSWSQHSALYDIDTTAPYTRISIGSFLGKRTEALGSLDGTPLVERV